MSLEVAVTLRRGGREIAARFVTGAGITALYGPSGAGKTSVLDAVAGLLRPAAGRVVLGGTVLFDKAQGIDLPPERRGCGVVFQDLRLFPHRRVRDNLLYGWKLAPPARRWMQLDEACAFLGIGHLLERMPRTLSGGEAQRVAIGRALLSAPRVLLLDEPLSSLDAPRREGIMQVIERIRDELHLPVVLVSHDLAEIDRLADQVVPMGEGSPPALP
ncbi:ATP-binding cassette domain-containing protein [Novosphingobium sp. KCTC 2891]|uniref:molybdenum ABC transporter ATP-binding protein n=1 Tax=Novosphingobium sp. KCTC 2891 TaxID=2989730 RepID=UPI0022222388|nr:ATP-binding cassette domain-containing protein [Novosphingobium sp. KCTC 2891]MCW1383891.1 ATP-binding cassette domain-containing protein [Novosphingobium sp. KCTC 2891]